MTIEELNALVRSGGIDEFVRVCEARQVKALSHIADDISGREGTRLVLLSGASSAGKTTTAKRLCTQLRVNGFEAMHLSTDDYFVGNSRNPRDENGEFDYECLGCVDLPRLAEDVNGLLAGKSVRMRRFDFVAHEGFDADSSVSLPKNGIIVLEGIHALNPALSEGFAAVGRYGLSIEPATQIVVFATSRLPPSDGRFLRRLVRDNQFRKVSPVETFHMWPKVLAGEKKWIDPFKELADARFDSGLEYELAVLKPYVAGLVEKAKLELPDDPRPAVFSELLSAIEATDPVKVPGDSILRETIGGSLLEY